MTRETDSPKPSTRRTGLNPQRLRRLELVSLLSKTGVVTLSNATVGNWLAAGCPRNPDGTLSLVQVCAWLAADRRKKSAPKASTITDELNRQRLADMRLDAEIKRRAYIPLDELNREWSAYGARLRTGLNTVAARHGRQCAIDIATVIDDILADIDAGLSERRKAVRKT